jgi:hypothetical protein
VHSSSSPAELPPLLRRWCASGCATRPRRRPSPRRAATRGCWCWTRTSCWRCWRRARGGRPAGCCPLALLALLALLLALLVVALVLAAAAAPWPPPPAAAPRPPAQPPSRSPSPPAPTLTTPHHHTPPPRSAAVDSAPEDDERRGDESRRLMIGLVGYPNVGKSSTINAIFGEKKTAVAPTPGKTKHFQTLNVSPRVGGSGGAGAGRGERGEAGRGCRERRPCVRARPVLGGSCGAVAGRRAEPGAVCPLCRRRPAAGGAGQRCAAPRSCRRPLARPADARPAAAAAAADAAGVPVRLPRPGAAQVCQQQGGNGGGGRHPHRPPHRDARARGGGGAPRRQVRGEAAGQGGRGEAAAALPGWWAGAAVPALAPDHLPAPPRPTSTRPPLRPPRHSTHLPPCRRRQLEAVYGFRLPRPAPHEAPDRPPTAAELLRAFAIIRGWVAGSGLPDETKAGRQILKDYVGGPAPRPWRPAI